MSWEIQGKEVYPQRKEILPFDNNVHIRLPLYLYRIRISSFAIYHPKTEEILPFHNNVHFFFREIRDLAIKPLNRIWIHPQTKEILPFQSNVRLFLPLYLYRIRITLFAVNIRDFTFSPYYSTFL